MSCLCVFVRATAEAGLRAKGANVNMSWVHTFEQVLACRGIEVRGTDWLFRRNDTMRVRQEMSARERESQGQRVIRLFSVRSGKLSSLRDEK